MALARHIVRLPESIRSQDTGLEALVAAHPFATSLRRRRHRAALVAHVALAVWQSACPVVGWYGAYVWIVGILVASQVAANILLGLYTNTWRYASVGDMGRVLALRLRWDHGRDLIVHLTVGY